MPTQTQNSTGWNTKGEGTHDTERNAWSVEYAPLVARRLEPAAHSVDSTGRLNFKVFRSKHATRAPEQSRIQSSLDQQALERDLQQGAELLSQRQQEVAARKWAEESFKSIGITQVSKWKSQTGRVNTQATVPKQRKRQTADAGEIMARLASERRATARNKRPRSDEGGISRSDVGSIPASVAHTSDTQTQANAASGPSARITTQKPPPKKQNRQRRGASFVVD